MINIREIFTEEQIAVRITAGYTIEEIQSEAQEYYENNITEIPQIVIPYKETNTYGEYYIFGILLIIILILYFWKFLIRQINQSKTFQTIFSYMTIGILIAFIYYFGEMKWVTYIGLMIVVGTFIGAVPATLVEIGYLKKFPWKTFLFVDFLIVYYIVTNNTETSLYVLQDSYYCSEKRYCLEMNSCEEATFYLNKCSLDRLDKDGDGIPCEWTLCN